MSDTPLHERTHFIEPGPARHLAFECCAEMMDAQGKWPKFNSAHEAFAILAEEVDELWDHVRTNQKRRDHEAMRKECIQIAAMAMRFAMEICTEDGVRK
jgi:NTP pyrophosphatase (non-canonical NTP hydrolase)